MIYSILDFDKIFPIIVTSFDFEIKLLKLYITTKLCILVLQPCCQYLCIGKHFESLLCFLKLPKPEPWQVDERPQEVG